MTMRQPQKFLLCMGIAGVFLAAWFALFALLPTAVVPYGIRVVFALPIFLFAGLAFCSLRFPNAFRGTAAALLASAVGCGFLFLCGAGLLVLKTDTEPVTDAAKYQAALDAVGYPTRGTYFFPSSIPEDAEDIAFSYSPSFGQGGLSLSLCFTAPEAERWVEAFRGFALWSGSASSWEKEEYGVFRGIDAFCEESSGDAALYILHSQAGARGDWNHGETGYCAVSPEDGRVLFRYEHW